MKLIGTAGIFKIVKINWPIAYLGLVFIVISLMFAAELNPSGGAKGDLFSSHFPTVEIYKQQNFSNAIIEQKSAMGPLYYIISSQIVTDSDELRAFSLVFLILSTLAMWLTSLKIANNATQGHQERHSNYSLAMRLLAIHVSVFMLNPLALGPALWGNPDSMALFFLVLSITCIVSIRIAWVSALLAGASFSLAFLTRQLLAPAIVILMVTAIFERGNFPHFRLSTYTLLVIPSAGAGIGLLYYWGGITPPLFRHHIGVNFFNPFIVICYVGALAALYLLFAEKKLWLLRRAKSLFLFRPSQSSDLISYLLLICAVFSFAFYDFPGGGGGIIEKPIILFNLLGINFLALPYIFFLSAIGVFFCSAFFRSCQWWYFAFIVFVLSFFITGERFYQKYFDPYFFIFFLIPAVLYYKSFVTNKVALLCCCYFLILLVTSTAYYAYMPVF